MDLLGCRVYIISPGKGAYRNRLAVCFQRLVDRGFRHIEFVRSIEGNDKTESLTRTTAWILEQELTREDPFLIVDDDIEVEDVPTTIILPEKAAAVYLGVCKWIYPYGYETIRRALLHIRTITAEDFTPYNEVFVRIHGMTSSHAILFLDRGFIRELLFKMKGNSSRPHDLILATLQKHHLVYALKQPLFFQDATIGGQEDVTRLTWSDNCFVYLKKTVPT